NLMNRYTEDHPQVKAALRDRDAAKADLDAALASSQPKANQVPNLKRRELEDQIFNYRHQISGSKAQLASVDMEVSAAQGKLKELKDSRNPLDAIDTEIVELSENRANLVNRLNLAKMDQDKTERLSEIVVMDKSGDLNPPVNTSSGRTKKIIILALL